MSLMRRVKAVFWWCHMHSGDARTATEKLATMPTDGDIDFLCRTYSASPKREDGGPEWGDGAVWEEFHHGGPVPLVARLTDGSTRSIGTHFLPYNPGLPSECVRRHLAAPGMRGCEAPFGWGAVVQAGPGYKALS